MGKHICDNQHYEHTEKNSLKSIFTFKCEQKIEDLALQTTWQSMQLSAKSPPARFPELWFCEIPIQIQALEKTPPLHLTNLHYYYPPWNFSVKSGNFSLWWQSTSKCIQIKLLDESWCAAAASDVYWFRWCLSTTTCCCCCFFFFFFREFPPTGTLHNIPLAVQ